MQSRCSEALSPIVSTGMARPVTDRRIANLPASLKQIAEHCGYSAAVRLVDVFPGYRIHIPHAVPVDHPLRLLGDELADNLARIYGGETIDIPTRLISAEARERLILELASRDRRLSMNEIAGEASTTRRHVFRVLRRAGVQRPVHD